MVVIEWTAIDRLGEQVEPWINGSSIMQFIEEIVLYSRLSMHLCTLTLVRPEYSVLSKDPG